MNRLAPWALLLALAALSTPAAATPHSPSVLEARHEPAQPARGQAVDLYLTLNATADPERVRAIYCRVESYACGEALTMVPTPDGPLTARIPWTGTFFQGVRTVGYQFELRHADGRLEHSPIENYPQTPGNLPAEGGIYYFYTLPDETPASAAWLALAALVAVALLARRRTR